MISPSSLQNILIADDEFGLLDAAASIFSKYDPITLSSPSKAIDEIKICELPFFIVISDYDFKDPELNGFSIYIEYRKRFPTSPFIFYTTDLPIEVARIVHLDPNTHFHPKSSSLLLLLNNFLISSEAFNNKDQFKEKE